MKKIAVLTSGGNAPGMNSAVCGVINGCKLYDFEPYIIYDGFYGLYHNKIEKVKGSAFENMTTKTYKPLGSARFPEFKDMKIREHAIKQLKKHGIDSLIVIGGDGSYQGAQKLTEMGVNCIGLPGTIDNDIAYTNKTIGFDTTLNYVSETIDRIREMADWHNRCNIIETMGRECGDIALYAGFASNVDMVITPENKYSEETIIRNVKKWKSENKRSIIILTTELMYNICDLAKIVEKESGYVTRATVIGHGQRGGKPSWFDRYTSYKMGIKAIELLKEGKGGLCIGVNDDQIFSEYINKALSKPSPSRKEDIKLFEKINKIIK